MTSRQQRASRADDDTPTKQQLEILADIERRPQEVEHYGMRRKMLACKWIEPTGEHRSPMEPVKYKLTDAGRAVLPPRKDRQT